MSLPGVRIGLRLYHAAFGRWTNRRDFSPGPLWPCNMPAARNPASLPTEVTPPTPDHCDVCGGPPDERDCKTICRRGGGTPGCGDPRNTGARRVPGGLVNYRENPGTKK